MRRTGSIVVLLCGLAGCDQGLRAEVAELREQVATQAAAQAALRDRLEQLEVELAREAAARIDGDEKRSTPPPAPEPELPPAVLNAACAGGTCTVTRAEVDALFAAPDVVMRSARIVPAMEGGKTLGFKLFGIRPGSPFANLGLLNGDRLTELGGKKLDGVEALMKALPELKKQSRWVIRGDRKGAPLEITIAVK